MTLRGLRLFVDPVFGTQMPDGWEWSDECAAMEAEARRDVRRMLWSKATEEEER